MNKTLEQLIVDTEAKESHRNNPDRPAEHKFSSYCSCGWCHMAHLCAEATREWITEIANEIKITGERYDKGSNSQKHKEGHNQALHDLLMKVYIKEII